MAYQELQKKRTEVTQKAAAAPAPASEITRAPRRHARQKRVERLRSGRGSRDDLAAFIAQHNL